MAALNLQAESFLYSISAMSLLTFGNGFHYHLAQLAPLPVPAIGAVRHLA